MPRYVFSGWISNMVKSNSLLLIPLLQGKHSNYNLTEEWLNCEIRCSSGALQTGLWDYQPPSLQPEVHRHIWRLPPSPKSADLWVKIPALRATRVWWEPVRNASAFKSFPDLPASRFRDFRCVQDAAEVAAAKLFPFAAPTKRFACWENLSRKRWKQLRRAPNRLAPSRSTVFLRACNTQLHVTHLQKSLSRDWRYTPRF